MLSVDPRKFSKLNQKLGSEKIMQKEPTEGKVYGSGQCVAFVQEYADIGPTSLWKRGQKVKGNSIAKGTPIATFNSQGIYTNSTDGSSHAAIFWSQDDNGITVYDQWKGQSCQKESFASRVGMVQLIMMEINIM